MTRIIQIILFATIVCTSCANAGVITGYRPYCAECSVKGSDETKIALRRFIKNGGDYCLLVNPVTLRTSLHRTDVLKCAENSTDGIRLKYKNTNYIRALEDSGASARKLQNAGFTHFHRKEKGVNLTVDLCPSDSPLDRILFTKIIDGFGNTQSPVPIGLSVTGVWMENHQPDITWLRDLEKRNIISVTWINHSYNHWSSRKLPLRHNFLLRKGTVIDFEVLATEKKMLELGIMPSIFFRFPGLVSNYRLVDAITGFGLIPIGSDAWLGKKQWPRKGSIVLVHANGHEPVGILRFVRLMMSQKENIINKNWLLHDLRDSVVDYESRRN